MGESVDCLHYAEIIYITVAVEVEVRDHVRRVVEKDLEISYIGRLGERCTDGLEVEVEAEIVVIRIDVGSDMSRWICNSS